MDHKRMVASILSITRQTDGVSMYMNDLSNNYTITKYRLSSYSLLLHISCFLRRWVIVCLYHTQKFPRDYFLRGHLKAQVFKRRLTH